MHTLQLSLCPILCNSYLVLLQAADATALAINSGIPRCQVEILLPEFWDPIR
jgi:hypothetical protein